MDILRKITGRSKWSKDTVQSIKKLRETEELLTKKQTHVEQQIETALEMAKKNGMKNKRGKLYGHNCFLITKLFAFDLPYFRGEFISGIASFKKEEKIGSMFAKNRWTTYYN